MKEILNYFNGIVWQQTELDRKVIKAVKEASSIIDVGCGFNQYKQFNSDNFIGIDIANPNADWVGDILNYKTDQRFKLAICYGSLHFYNYEWIKNRFEKILALTLTSGIIMMKVNPGINSNYPLPFFKHWTWPLAEHFAEVYNLQISDKHEWYNPNEGTKRLKWTYNK